MILADENIDPYFIEILRASGIQVFSIREISPGITDAAVIRLARELNYVILTEDKGFGDWVFAHALSDTGIILLRYHQPEKDRIGQILVKIILQLSRSILGKIVVVTSSKTRIRSL